MTFSPYCKDRQQKKAAYCIVKPEKKPHINAQIYFQGANVCKMQIAHFKYLLAFLNDQAQTTVKMSDLNRKIEIASLLQ